MKTIFFIVAIATINMFASVSAQPIVDGVVDTVGLLESLTGGLLGK